MIWRPYKLILITLLVCLVIWKILQKTEFHLSAQAEQIIKTTEQIIKITEEVIQPTEDIDTKMQVLEAFLKDARRLKIDNDSILYPSFLDTITDHLQLRKQTLDVIKYDSTLLIPFRHWMYPDLLSYNPAGNTFILNGVKLEDHQLASLKRTAFWNKTMNNIYHEIRSIVLGNVINR